MVRRIVIQLARAGTQALDGLKGQNPMRMSQVFRLAFKPSRPAAGAPATRFLRGGVEEPGKTTLR
jgi:hypothetical protein